jgi:enterochelin esterase family protein
MLRSQGGAAVARIDRTTFRASLLIAIGVAASAAAQAPPQGPQVVSPEVTSDRRIVLRIVAPQAQAVRLNASDIPGVPFGQGTALAKGQNGIWEITLGPVPAGAYRYTFTIDGVATIDPRNPSTSESNNNSWSLVYVSGSDAFDTRNVPHGSVADVHYYSTALRAFRRMHVYTPPGYETSSKKYPVFYLLHGAGDSDDSWSTVGRAGFILDNLIAAKSAKPMIVVMPAGHTRTQANPIASAFGDPFVDDFVSTVMPYVQANYRVQTDRANTAIAGLSMGGGQALNVLMSHPERFAYVGVYSSGLFFRAGGRGGAAAPTASLQGELEKRYAAALSSTSMKKGLKLVWFSTGEDDFVLANTIATVEFFKKHGFTPVYTESAGGHTWLNWRDYLNTFAPQLFQ